MSKNVKYPTSCCSKTVFLAGIISGFFTLFSYGQVIKPKLRVPMGHTNVITTMTFSKDGKLLATGGADNTFIIWDTKTGAEIRKVNVEEPVQQLRFGADDSYIITVSGQVAAEYSGKYTLMKWDVLSGKLLGKMAYSGSPVLQRLRSVNGFLLNGNSSTMQKIMEQTKNMNIMDPAAFDKIDYTKIMNQDSIMKDVNKRLEELLKEMSKLDLTDKKNMEEYTRRSREIYLQNYNNFNPYKKEIILLDPQSFKMTTKLPAGIEKAYTIHFNNIDYILSSEMTLYPTTSESRNNIHAWEIKSLMEQKNGQQLPPAWKKYPVKAINNSLFVSGEKGFFAINTESSKKVQIWQLNQSEPLTTFTVKGSIFSGINFSPDGLVLYVFSSSVNVNRSRVTYIEGWNTANFQQESIVTIPEKYLSGNFDLAPSGDYFVAVAAYPTWRILKLNRYGDSTGIFTGRSAAPSYFGFAPGSKQVYVNYGGQPEIGEYFKVSTTATVEHEAYKKGQVLSSEEKEKLVNEKLKAFHFLTTGDFPGYNLLWDLERGGVKPAKAQAFTPDHPVVSEDKNYLLINERYESESRVPNPSFAMMLKQPIEGVSKETMNRLAKYYDTSSLFYKHVFANYRNGPTTVLINKKTKDSISLIKIDSLDWIMVLKNGYYMASKTGAKALNYVSGMQVYPFEQFDLKYNRPDKVLQAIGLADPLLIGAYRKAYQKRIKKANIDTTQFNDEYELPEADFANRGQVLPEQNTDKLSLVIIAKDKKNKLDRFNVWINEVPVFGKNGKSIKSLKSNELNTTVEVILSQGVNRIETSVLNSAGVESYRVPLIINYTPAVKQKETTHFVGIGIEQFAESKYNLQYSVKDIRDLSVKMKEKYGNDIIIDTLFNEKVTVSNVKALKQKLQRTNVNDKVIVSYSGHGLLSKDFDYYLSTYSINFDKPEQNGLPYDELESLLDSIPARKKLMLIDACHSGEVDKEDLVTLNTGTDSLIKGIKPVAYKKDGQLGLKNSFELMQSLFVNVGKSTGATIISAAAGTQFALERSDLKNGVFTYSILEAMKNHPQMKISELKTFVGKRVEELTKGLQKPTSRNETIAVDWNVW